MTAVVKRQEYNGFYVCYANLVEYFNGIFISDKKHDMTGVDAMEVELEDSQVLLNSPDLNRQAVILQKNLEELKMKIIKQLHLLNLMELLIPHQMI